MALSMWCFDFCRPCEGPVTEFWGQVRLVLRDVERFVSVVRREVGYRTCQITAKAADRLVLEMPSIVHRAMAAQETPNTDTQREIDAKTSPHRQFASAINLMLHLPPVGPT
jgi:hypothetical protein